MRSRVIADCQLRSAACRRVARIDPRRCCGAARFRSGLLDAACRRRSVGYAARALATLLAAERARLRSAATTKDGRPPSEIAARLAALRDELRRRRLAGFVVPRGDEHQGEYVAARVGAAGLADRLHRLGRHRGGACATGRRCSSTAATPRRRRRRWSRAVRHSPCDAPADGRMAGRRRCRRRRGSATIRGCTRRTRRRRCSAPAARRRRAPVPVDGNPIEPSGTDQPPPPIAPIVPHDVAFAGSPSRRQARTHRRDAARRQARRGVAGAAGRHRLAAQHPRRRRAVHAAAAGVRAAACATRGCSCSSIRAS